MGRADALLARARAASGDPFMARMVAGYDRRQAASRELAVARQRRADELAEAGLSPSESELQARQEIVR